MDVLHVVFVVGWFLCTVLMVDFFSGLLHWIEDTFWTVDTPIIGNWLVKPNVLHHEDGQAFIQNSYWYSSRDLLILGLLILIVAYVCRSLTWQVWLFVLLGANANQIHKWSHQNHDAPYLIRLLQRIHVLQRPERHWRHHIDDKNTHYCVITNFLNPVLDGLHFWRLLEKLLVPVFGAPRRTDIIS